jgi:AraC-like DNA-binding protein
LLPPGGFKSIADMNGKLFSSLYGPIKLLPGLPSRHGIKQLPDAKAYHAILGSGNIFFQELRMGGYLLRYFVFSFLEPVTLAVQEEGEGFQSLLSLKGELEHKVQGMEGCRLGEGQFILLDAGHQKTETVFPGGRECHVLNTYYSASGYKDLLPLFPSFGDDISGAAGTPRLFLPAPRPVGTAVLDAVQELFYKTYRPHLQRTYWELKLKQALFAKLAETYTEPATRHPTQVERELAWKARDIIVQDIALHHSNEALAQMTGWSESSLKRAFRREFGMGPYEYLRRLRMEEAHRLLQQGHQVKTVAMAVGMRPSQLTTEFKKHFGYKATAVKRGGGGEW